MVDIKRARELLGKKGERMSDEEIITLQTQLSVLADIIIDQVVSMTPEERAALGKKLKKEKTKNLNKGAGKVR
jgi:hypothetical protein